MNFSGELSSCPGKDEFIPKGKRTPIRKARSGDVQKWGANRPDSWYGVRRRGVKKNKKGGVWRKKNKRGGGMGDNLKRGRFQRQGRTKTRGFLRKKQVQNAVRPKVQETRGRGPRICGGGKNEKGKRVARRSQERFDGKAVEGKIENAVKEKKKFSRKIRRKG